MSGPKRVQMSRQRPWRAEHPDAVIVSRPTRWGSPFRIGASVAVGPLGPSYRIRDAEDAVGLFANWLSTPVNADGTRILDGWDRYFGAVVADRPTIAQIRAELAGKDLACWCRRGDWCHADVLLEVANEARA